ncbi:ribonuclease H-like domain-containing protein [Tanacetum coccineum]
MASIVPEYCQNFAKGFCKFGDGCKFIHDQRQRNLNIANAYNQSNVSDSNGGVRTHAIQGSARIVHPHSWTSHDTFRKRAHLAKSFCPHVQQPITDQQAQSIGSTSSAGILGLTPLLPNAFSTMTLQDPTWSINTGATSHLNSNAPNLSIIFNTCLFPSIHVGDGNSIPVTNTGHSIIPSIHRPLHLHNVLVTPNIIKNLIFVCQFTRDNNCTIEFDVFGFSVKDFLTRHILLRCDSSSDLYPVTKLSTLPTAFVSTSSTTWHQSLGHLGMKFFVLLLY